MRLFFSALLVILALPRLSAQSANDSGYPIDETTGLITYKEVVEEQGTKDELFNRCSSWLHTYFANPWEAAKVRDQATGLIKIQHQFRLDESDENGNKVVGKMIMYNMKIEFKDGRYRYVIDNIVAKEAARYPVEKWLDKDAPGYNAANEAYLAQIDKYFRDELVKSLKNGMKPGKEAKNDDW